VACVVFHKGAASERSRCSRARDIANAENWTRQAVPIRAGSFSREIDGQRMGVRVYFDLDRAQAEPRRGREARKERGPHHDRASHPQLGEATLGILDYATRATKCGIKDFVRQDIRSYRSSPSACDRVPARCKSFAFDRSASGAYAASPASGEVYPYVRSRRRRHGATACSPGRPVREIVRAEDARRRSLMSSLLEGAQQGLLGAGL